MLGGPIHGDFAVFWSKLLKYLTKNLFANMKLLLEHREEIFKGFLQGRTNYNQFLSTSLKYTGRTCLTIRSQTLFCALAGLLLKKLNHYFNDSINSNLFLAIQSGDTKKVTLLF